MYIALIHLFEIHSHWLRVDCVVHRNIKQVLFRFVSICSLTKWEGDFFIVDHVGVSSALTVSCVHNIFWTKLAWVYYCQVQDDLICLWWPWPNFRGHNSGMRTYIYLRKIFFIFLVSLSCFNVLLLLCQYYGSHLLLEPYI